MQISTEAALDLPLLSRYLCNLVRRRATAMLVPQNTQDDYFKTQKLPLLLLFTGPHHVEEPGHDGVADHVLRREQDVVVAVVDVVAAHRAEAHEVLSVSPVHLLHDPAQNTCLMSGTTQ